MLFRSTSVYSSGQPAKIELKVSGSSVTATVTDASGNPVADNTPVRWTIPQTVGSTSAACSSTVAGKATTTVVLVGATGSILATTDWNETTSATECAARNANGNYNNANVAGPGADSLSATVAISGGAAAPAPASGAAGGFVSAPIYSSGKLANAVFNGGTIAQLGTALAGAKASGVWAQDSKGNFQVWIGGDRKSTRLNSSH